MEAAARTLHGGAEVALPVLVLHGGDDGLCDPAGSEAFYASLPPSPGSDLRIYPGLRHEIFQEPEQEKIFEEVLAWLRQHETALA